MIALLALSICLWVARVGVVAVHPSVCVVAVHLSVCVDVATVGAGGDD